MKKRISWKKTAALSACAFLAAATAAGGFASLPAYAASYANTYNVNTSRAFQEFDGWGLSLSWWATEIGSWTRTGSSGKQKREEIMDAIYGRDGLNLNIARYNVGGGDDPTHGHMTDDRNTPGWKGAAKDTFTDAEGHEISTFIENENYVFTAADGSTLSWEQTPDWRQLWVLDWIQNYRDDAITEFYSNSPPYWMTKTGCSSGGEGGWDNLDPVNNEAFVNYLLDVYEYLTAQGFEFQNIQPFNESGSTYWGTGGDQEGRYFGPQQKVDVLELLVAGMEERGIDAAYNVGDETSTSVANDQYTKMRGSVGANGTYGADLVDGASRLTYHIYSYDINGAQRMYRNAKSHGQEVYMSEICFTSGSEYDPEAMDTGFQYTQSIIDTVKYGGVDGYVFWQGMEDMVGQIKSGTNYGLIQGVYYTQEEAEALGTDLASLGYAYQDFVLSKAYYMSGQYTKYIKAGYTIVDVEDDGSMAAISPDGKTLVIVKQNKGTQADSFKFALNGFKADSVERITTDRTHNWAYSRLSTDGESVIDLVPASSVTTYVVHGSKTGADSYFLDDSMATILADETAIAAALEEGGETEQFYATYSSQHPNSGYDEMVKKSYFGGFYSNQNDYMAIRFKGTGFALTFPKKSDAGNLKIWVDKAITEEPVTVSLKNSTEIDKSLVYDVNTLDDGWHTVWVQGTDGYINYDGAFIYTSKGVQPETRKLVFENVAGVGGKLNFTYASENLGGYTVFLEQYENGEWVRGTEPLADGAGSLTGLTEETVEIRLAAVKEGEEFYSPEQVVTILYPEEGVLYFVDCGTTDPASLSVGAVLGENQSVSDQAYGKDPATGLIWGHENTYKTAGDVGFYAEDEAMTSSMTLEKVNEQTLTYKFTIPVAGSYKVTLGFFGGGDGWGSRAVKADVAGNSQETTLQEQTYSALYFDVTTQSENQEITVSVTKGDAEGSYNSLLSAIVITEQNVKVPLYASAASTFNTQQKSTAPQVTLGGDLFEQVKSTAFTVYYSDNTTEEFTYADVQTSVDAGLMRAGSDAVATFTVESIPGLAVMNTYTWMQEGAEVLYYNIDCAFMGTDTPPDDGKELGAKQSTTHDREFGEDSKGASWGYVGSNFNNGINWRDDKENKWSIREGLDDGASVTYKMTGFKANEALRIAVSGHCSNWGSRSFSVLVNGTEVGTVELVKDADPVIVEFSGENVTADASGELTVKCQKKSGDGPQVSFIKVWSMGENLPKEAAITADRTTASRDDTITLRGLNTAATVYVLDENNKILGNFKPAAESQSVKLSDYLPENSYELRFTQAVADVTSLSAALVVDTPAVDVITSSVFVKDGEATAVTFVPHAAHGVTSLTLRTPDGAEWDLLENFFYRAFANGTYTVTIVSNGASYSKEFEVKNVDTLLFNEQFSETGWTDKAVVLTLAPQAASGIVSVFADGQELHAEEGKYTLTAEKNGEFHVTVKTAAGFEYEKVFTVSNIDTAAPVLTLTPDYTEYGALMLRYEAEALSGGKLMVAFNGGTPAEVTEQNAYALNEEGKYEFWFVNGAGKETAKTAYTVKFGGATVGEDGTVTLEGGASFTLYRAGDGTSYTKAEKAGKYYAVSETAQGTEITVFRVAAEASGTTGTSGDPGTSGGKGGCKSVSFFGMGGAAAGMLVGLTLLAAVLRRRNVKGRKNS